MLKVELINQDIKNIDEQSYKVLEKDNKCAILENIYDGNKITITAESYLKFKKILGNEIS